MIIWRGKGIFSLLSIPLAMLITVGFLGQVLQIEPFSRDYRSQKETLLVGATLFILAAILNTIFLYIPGLKDKLDQIVTKADGSKMRISYRGSLFFIPRKIWSIIFAVLSLGLFIASFFAKGFSS